MAALLIKTPVIRAILAMIACLDIDRFLIRFLPSAKLGLDITLYTKKCIVSSSRVKYRRFTASRGIVDHVKSRRQAHGKDPGMR
jgi:hypothetical protein